MSFRQSPDGFLVHAFSRNARDVRVLFFGVLSKRFSRKLQIL